MLRVPLNEKCSSKSTQGQTSSDLILGFRGLLDFGFWVLGVLGLRFRGLLVQGSALWVSSSVWLAWTCASKEH